jgi:purine-binding chemotaxis protein CheW
MSSNELEHLLTFIVAGEELAMSLGSVEEVVGCGRITRVPSMPLFVRGAMNLRGRALPVIDLAAKLGFAETIVTRWTCLLAVRVPIQGEPTLLGVLVDAVNQLHDVPREQIEPPPSFGTSVHPEYVRGVLHADDKLVLVLDIARILSADELRLVSSVAVVTEECP